MKYPAGLHSYLLCFYEWIGRGVPRLRGICFQWLFGLRFYRLGKGLTLRGGRAMAVGSFVSIGDGCWIEAVVGYQGRSYSPHLVIENHVSLSHWTHISCVAEVIIGEGCLIGSKVYIGDHSHGSVWNGHGVNIGLPGQLPLQDFGAIYIGAGTWIGDGAVILAGTEIGAGSIVGANSVVKLREPRAALIAGVPARIIRYLK